MRICPYCGNEMSKKDRANNCKYCNQRNNKRIPIWLFLIVFFLVIPLVFGILFSIFKPLINSMDGNKNSLESELNKEIECDDYRHILSFRDSNDNLLMDDSVLSSGSAKITMDEVGRPAIALSVKDKDVFYDVTKAISLTEDKLIVIWLDYQDGVDSYANTLGVDGSSLCGTDSTNCLSAATVSQGFASDVIIQGNFTQKELEEMVIKINCSLNK